MCVCPASLAEDAANFILSVCPAFSYFTAPNAIANICAAKVLCAERRVT